MGVYFGIDVGTSGTKTLAIDADGSILAKSSVNYPLSSPHPGWSEQSPEDWWQAVVGGVQQVIQQGRIAPADVKGIGLSGQMHGSVFLNKRHEVIRPAILWNDQRTAAECEEIEQAAGGRAGLIKLVANPALTGFTAPKMIWLRKREPRNFDRTVKVLLPKDYVRLRLTGELATEVSDASGTLLLDVRCRKWSKRLLEKLQLDRSLLPAVYESEEVSGELTASAGKLLGLPAGVPVVGGAGDQAAGALGSGIVKRGVVSATMGTSGVVFAHTDTVQIDPHGRVHTFCHAVRDKWHVMGVVLSAGGSLEWFRKELGDAEVAVARSMNVEPHDLMTAQAANAPAGCEGLFFLPYLTGERTPHADPYARGAWIGLSRRHGRAHLVRSVLEGATYAMRDCLEIIECMGIAISEMRLSGGGAESGFWRQMQADVYGRKVCTVNSAEGPAYGVALLAAAGTGAYKNVVEACTRTIKAKTAASPVRRTARTYNRHYPLFQRLYRSLQDDFRSIAEVVAASK